MSVRLPSLRLWIQSTSLLVFFAGFVLFFVTSFSVLGSEHYKSHEFLILRIRQGLRRGDLKLPLNSPLGFRAELVEGGQGFEPIIINDSERRYWLQSSSPLPQVGPDSFLLVSQDISLIEEHHQHVYQFTLIIAALIILFSALLLRVVLWRGLTKPLCDLSSELDRLEADTLGSRLIDSELQPVELKPFVHSLNQLQERLASSWRRERCFVDGVAHELRTPITVLSTNSQLLLPDISDESKSTVQLLISESQRLGDLLSVMLDFARVDAGRIVLSPNLFDPELLCVDAFERLQCLSPDRIRLCEPVDKVFPKILVDDQRFHQCMAALVENALRYTHGYVDLSLTITRDYVVFHVIDCGSGIPAEEREFVVTRFARGSTSIGTRGSGIGLAVVHEFMLLMDGNLSICDSSQGGADVKLMFNF